MVLNETTLNVFRNYVPNKYITVDDKDPVWMNETIKSKVKTKNKLFSQYIQNGRFESDFVLVERSVTELSDIISHTKTLCYENLAKNERIHCCKQKHIGRFLKHFTMTKKFL